MGSKKPFCGRAMPPAGALPFCKLLIRAFIASSRIS